MGFGVPYYAVCTAFAIIIWIGFCKRRKWQVMGAALRRNLRSLIHRLSLSRGPLNRATYCTTAILVIEKGWFLGHFLHSPIPPVKNVVFDWTFFQLDSSGPSSYRQSSRFFFLFFLFCARPRGGRCEGALLYCCMAVENRLAALCLARSNLRPSELVASGL